MSKIIRLHTASPKGQFDLVMGEHRHKKSHIILQLPNKVLYLLKISRNIHVNIIFVTIHLNNQNNKIILISSSRQVLICLGIGQVTCTIVLSSNYLTMRHHFWVWSCICLRLKAFNTRVARARDGTPIHWYLIYRLLSWECLLVLLRTFTK